MSVRQAIVIVHGMGEQKPLDQLRRFVDTAFPPVSARPPMSYTMAGLTTRFVGERFYISRPDKITDSYESRRYLAPRRVVGDKELYAQTELYEFHWAHLMQGNRLDDLWPTFRRVFLQWPNRVPNGLRVMWFLVWAILIATGVGIWLNRKSINFGDTGFADILAVLLGTSLAATALTYVLTQFGPRWLKSSLVDVVRYLDTSPRSYSARQSIRKAAVDLLEGLHESGRYDRVIIVAHSLGAFIAYDAITYYWSRVNKLHAGFLPFCRPNIPVAPEGLGALEAAAEAIDLAVEEGRAVTDEMRVLFRRAQRDLWIGTRAMGNPWLITDFISVGTPMYMADQIATLGRPRLSESVEKLEVPVCPPKINPVVPDAPPADQTRFTWVNKGRRTLYHAAPFAVTRWTNMWFPARAGFFGDWFGGPLRPLFGYGIEDIPLYGNDWKKWIPGFAHTKYFTYGDDRGEGDVAAVIEQALDLPSTSWVEPTTSSPEYSESTR